MKIVYFVKDIHTTGGIERVTINKANWLARNGQDVFIITSDQGGKEPIYKLSNEVHLIDLGLNYHKSKGKNLFIKLIRFIYIKAIQERRIKKALKQVVPDVIVSTFGPEMGCLSKINGFGKKVLEFHSAIVQFQNMKKANGIRGIINRALYESIYNKIKRFDRFVVLDENEIGAWKVENVIGIPNACIVEKENIQPPVRKSKIAIAVGRLSVEKNYSSMIQAWAIVADKHPEWELHIFGKGPEQESIIGQISEKNLIDKIKLMGVTQNIADEYKRSYIFLMTSTYEGQPMSLIEAQSYGLPAVVMETDGRMGKIVDSGKSGYVIQDRDINKMAEKVIRLIECSEEDWAKKSAYALEIREKFNEETIMNRWMNLFHELLSD